MKYDVTGALLLLVVIGLSGVASGSDVQKDGHMFGKWTMDYEAAKKAAAEKKLPILLNFTGSDWCGWCKLMDRNVFSKQAWKDYARKNLVLVWVDFPSNKSLVPAKYAARNNALKTKYGIKGFPTYVMLDSKASSEIARFGAGRNKTPESFIAEIAAVTKKNTQANVRFAKDVTNEQERVVREAMSTYEKATPEEKKKLAAKTIAKLAATMKLDPVLIVLINPKAMIGMIPYLQVTELAQLTQILKDAEKSGTPIDGFRAALDQLAATEKSDLRTIQGLMYVYSSMGQQEKGLKLMPEIDVLEQIGTAPAALNSLKVLKHIGRFKTALEFAFHMQKKLKIDADKQKFFNEIISMADKADDAFLTEWLKHVSENPKLLEALRKQIASRAKSGAKATDSGSRIAQLKGNSKIVNIIAVSKPSKTVSRQYLRHWQLEFANALAKYRSASAQPTPRNPYMYNRSSSRRKPPAFVPFKVLLECKLPPQCISVLPKEEAKLHKFQLVVCRIKTGDFDEEGLKQLIAFKDHYPASVAAHCAAFLEDWGKKVNPNARIQSRPRYGSYYYYNMRQSMPTGIPLTRARQVQNLEHCSRIFELFRKAGITIPESAMLTGFKSCFSRAEIISKEDILRVFPDVNVLSDEFLVQLSSQVIGEMRANWMKDENRQKLQQMYRTNRTESDIDQETARAYRGLIDLVRQRIEISKDSIPLRNVMAALSFDLAEFSKVKKLAKLEEYTKLRDSAFRMFEECYQIYQKKLPKLQKHEYSVDYLKYWYSAVFGASDLGALDVSLKKNPTQLERVKAALDNMQEPYRDAHKTLFGEWISGQWKRLKPHVKLNVIQSTLEIMGNHKSVEPLVKQMKLYKGLIKEAKLYAKVDGSTNVGFENTFGVILKLRHTDALEREAGGFSKYIQNQQRVPGSRVPVDYRNNFAANISKALKERFEIVGIAWMDNSVHSVETTIPHWRETPLAYVSLKALDATVDRIPSIQLDLDFSDGAGNVVLPILSNVVVIDSRKKTPPPRPANKVEVRLILDARKAAEGDLKLDVQMIGEGVLPPAPSILKPSHGYTFAENVDVDNLVLKLEQRDHELIPHSEQNAVIPIKWLGKTKNGRFAFPEVELKDAKVVYQQYRDADIVAAKKTVVLGQAKSAASYAMWWIGGLVLVIAVVVFVIIARATPAPEEAETAKFTVPKKVDGVSVLALLERIRQSDQVSLNGAKEQLDADIHKIEESCFSQEGKGEVDLDQIVKSWIKRIS